MGIGGVNKKNRITNLMYLIQEAVIFSFVTCLISPNYYWSSEPLISTQT